QRCGVHLGSTVGSDLAVDAESSAPCLKSTIPGAHSSPGGREPVPPGARKSLAPPALTTPTHHHAFAAGTLLLSACGELSAAERALPRHFSKANGDRSPHDADPARPHSSEPEAGGPQMKTNVFGM